MSNSVETLEPFEDEGKSGKVKRWLQELGIAGEWQRNWEDRSKQVIERYQGETTSETSFNILHSNTETLRPNLFAQKPEPDVRRRITNGTPTEREAAEVLERAIRYTNDSTPYEDEVNCAVNDYLLPGRAVLRVRYTPTVVQRNEQLNELDEGVFFTDAGNMVEPEDIQRDQDGKPFIQIEELQFERADVEHVPYDDFRHHPAKRWADVRWVAFRHYFTRDELDRGFGKTKSSHTMLTVEDGRGPGRTDADLEPDLFKKAEVWEIWDKQERKILFISPGNVQEPLLEIDDGPDYYNLNGFFPTPKPLNSINTPGTLEPIPEFTIYQDLADELDEITGRITKIVAGIDVRGAYDGASPELATILEGNNKLIGVDNWNRLQEKGGLSSMLDFVPIEPQVKAFVALVQQRDQLIQTIYQTIGLSDISRGTSDPRETATAQRLKGQFGNQRLSPRQREWQRYLRDVMRIQAELIAEKFEPTTLQIMSGVEINEEIMLLLRNDALRNFAIDIETDSTIAIDQAAAQADIKEMLEGLAALGQARQALPKPAQLPLTQAVIRKFKLGRDIEIAMEEAQQSGQAEQPSPEAMKAQAEQQKAQLQAEIKAKELELKDLDSQRKYDVAKEKNAIEADKAEADVIQGVFNE